MKKLAFILMVFLASNALNAQSLYTENTLKLDSLTNVPNASIDDVAWLAGNWVGEAFGGLAEEIWSDPAGGAMMGVFRSVTGGEVAFYELLTISELDHSIILRLKHFNANLTGWEEKGVTVDFPLIKINKDGVWFEGQTILKDGKNGYKVYLAMERANGEVKEVEFQFTRRKGSR